MGQNMNDEMVCSKGAYVRFIRDHKWFILQGDLQRAETKVDNATQHYLNITYAVCLVCCTLIVIDFNRYCHLVL